MNLMRAIKQIYARRSAGSRSEAFISLVCTIHERVEQACRRRHESCGLSPLRAVAPREILELGAPPALYNRGIGPAVIAGPSVGAPCSETGGIRAGTGRWARSKIYV
jgi:hypothetical protein